MEIPFTQYLMPGGRTVPVLIDMPADCASAALALLRRGYRFECEMLGDFRTLSLTCVDPADTGDIAIELASNGPEVPEAVKRLVASAWQYAESAGAEAEEPK